MQIDKTKEVIGRVAQFINSTRRRWSWLGYGLTVIATVYMAILLWYGGSQLRNVDLQHYLPAIGYSLFIYFISLTIQFFVWLRLFSVHHRVGWRDLNIYSRMILLRRLPGGIWHWVGRAALYSSTTNIPPRVAILANVWDMGMLLLVAGSIISIGQTNWPLPLRWTLALLSGSAALLLAFKWQKSDQRRQVRVFESLLWIVLYFTAWVMGGVILFLFVHSSQNNSLDFWHAVYAWTLAGGIGTLIIIIPAGLGIREITLTWLLQPYLPTAVAILISIMLRILFIVADIIWGVIGWQFSRFFLSRSDKGGIDLRD